MPGNSRRTDTALISQASFRSPTRRPVRSNDRDIGEVLKMSVAEAVDFFRAHPKIHHALELMQAVGLGYLTLGQPSPTLSGGEAQRIKLVTELAKARPDVRRQTQSHTLYILDVIAEADWLLDLGPGAAVPVAGWSRRARPSRSRRRGARARRPGC